MLVVSKTVEQLEMDTETTWAAGAVTREGADFSN